MFTHSITQIPQLNEGEKYYSEKQKAFIADAERALDKLKDSAIEPIDHLTAEEEQNFPKLTYISRLIARLEELEPSAYTPLFEAYKTNLKEIQLAKARIAWLIYETARAYYDSDRTNAENNVKEAFAVISARLDGKPFSINVLTDFFCNMPLKDVMTLATKLFNDPLFLRETGFLGSQRATLQLANDLYRQHMVLGRSVNSRPGSGTTVQTLEWSDYVTTAQESLMGVHPALQALIELDGEVSELEKQYNALLRARKEQEDALKIATLKQRIDEIKKRFASLQKHKIADNLRNILPNSPNEFQRFLDDIIDIFDNGEGEIAAQLAAVEKKLADRDTDIATQLDACDEKLKQLEELFSYTETLRHALVLLPGIDVKLRTHTKIQQNMERMGPAQQETLKTFLADSAIQSLVSDRQKLLDLLTQAEEFLTEGEGTFPSLTPQERLAISQRALAFDKKEFRETYKTFINSKEFAAAKEKDRESQITTTDLNEVQAVLQEAMSIAHLSDEIDETSEDVSRYSRPSSRASQASDMDEISEDQPGTARSRSSSKASQESNNDEDQRSISRRSSRASQAANVPPLDIPSIKSASAPSIALPQTDDEGPSFFERHGDDIERATAIGSSSMAIIGGIVGGIVGALLAPVTLGLSIPIGIGLGAGAGLAGGMTIGAIFGFIGGIIRGVVADAQTKEVSPVTQTPQQRIVLDDSPQPSPRHLDSPSSRLSSSPQSIAKAKSSDTTPLGESPHRIFSHSPKGRRPSIGDFEVQLAIELLPLSPFSAKRKDEINYDNAHKVIKFVISELGEKEALTKISEIAGNILSDPNNTVFNDYGIESFKNIPGVGNYAYLEPYVKEHFEKLKSTPGPHH